jgi:hypothetical protein
MLRKWRSIGGLVLSLGLVLAMVGGGTVGASATQGDDHKVTICHRTASVTNPYVEESVDRASVDGILANDNGQGDHYAEHIGPIAPAVGADGKWGDIIPAITGVHSGLNWTAAGQAILANGCNLLSESSITTTTPSTASLGQLLQDQATLSGTVNTTGTITFNLYNPGGVLAYNEAATVSGNGTYSTVTGHIADATGTWHWQAVYSGDKSNKGASSTLDSEPVVVSLADPSIATTPHPTSALVGDILNDTAALGGGYNPTGAITFTLYDPSNAAVHTESVSVSGNGNYSTSVGHIAGVDGTWHWKAEYSGDANNKAKASAVADEPVVVSKGEIVRDPTSIVTTPNPTTALVGATLKDSATLTGDGDPQGTITFTLFDPTNAAVHTEYVAVDGEGTYSTPLGHVAGSAGTWHWMAEYSGDEHNLPSASIAESEPVVVSEGQHERQQPTISTTPSPTSTTVGGTLKDLATLGAGSNPTGSITFTLYNQANVVVHSEEVAVAGNGTYATPQGHIADLAGTWHWKAAYSGDANNLPVASNMADEPVIVGPTGGVLAATGATSAGQALGVTLLLFGVIALMGGLAWRRRQA